MSLSVSLFADTVRHQDGLTSIDVAVYVPDSDRSSFEAFVSGELGMSSSSSCVKDDDLSCAGGRPWYLASLYSLNRTAGGDGVVNAAMSGLDLLSIPYVVTRHCRLISFCSFFLSTAVHMHAAVIQLYLSLLFSGS